MSTCHGTLRFQKKHREWPWSIRLPPNSVRSSRIFQAWSTCPDRKVRFSCSIYKPPHHLTLNKPPYPYVKTVEIEFIKGWPVAGKEASLVSLPFSIVLCSDLIYINYRREGSCPRAMRIGRVRLVSTSLTTPNCCQEEGEATRHLFQQLSLGLMRGNAALLGACWGPSYWGD